MDERLEGEAVRLEGGDLVEGELARQDGARKAEVGKAFELGARVRVELRAGVQLEHRVGVVDERREAEIGDDQGVEPGAVGRLKGGEGGFELVVFEQDVQGEMDAGAEEMSAVDRREQGRRREVAGEGARAPRLEPKVDGVGAGRQGRLQGRRPPGRRQQLGPRPGGGPGRATEPLSPRSASTPHRGARG